MPGHFLSFLLLLIVSPHTPDFISPHNVLKLQWSWSYKCIQYGPNPKGSFISSCSFMCHRLLFPLLARVSTGAPIPTFQVCLKLNCKLNSNLICGPLSHITLFSSQSYSGCWCCFLQYFIHKSPIPPSVWFSTTPICSRCHAFNSCCHLKLKAVGCVVQSNQTVAAQPLCATTRERWHSVFHCVCLPFPLSLICNHYQHILPPILLSSTANKLTTLNF